MAVDITAGVSDVLKSVDTAGSSIIGIMGGAGGFGFKLLGVLFGIMFFYYVILWMMDKNGKIVVELTKLMITWSILAAMLTGWTETGGLGVSVSEFFLKSIPSISESYTASIGGGDPTDTIVQKHSEALTSILQILAPSDTAMEQKAANKLKYAIPVVGSYYIAKDVVKSVSDAAVGGTVGNIADGAGILSYAISLVLLVIAGFFILWSLLTFVFILNAGQIMMYVGLALGPVLIPFLILPPLSFLFNGWLRFMIAASLYKVVAVIIALMTIGTINAIVLYATQTSTTQDSLIFISLMVLFYSMLGKQMMGLADNIASTLATGGANSGGIGDSSTLIMGAAKTTTGIKNKNPPQKDGGSSPASTPAPAAGKPAYRRFK